MRIIIVISQFIMITETCSSLTIFFCTFNFFQLIKAVNTFMYEKSSKLSKLWVKEPSLRIGAWNTFGASNVNNILIISTLVG